MSTGAEFANFVFKKLLGSEDFKERLLDFLRADTREVIQRVYDVDGTFTPTGTPIVPTGGGVDLMDFIQSPDEDYRGTDGLGNILSLGETGSEDAGAGQIKTGVPFENTSPLKYWWSLQHAERVKGIQINPRTGLPEYVTNQAAIGVADDPDSVVDNGGSITLVIDSVCEAGHSHAGRTALVYLKTPVRGATTEAIAIESLTVTWNAVNNRITTAATLGQSTVSTTPADYTVVLLGPTVRKVDTETTAGHWFLADVTGTGGAAGTGVTTEQKLITQSLISLLDYAGGPTWADGTTNPATTIVAQLTKIITDLTSTSGARGLGKFTAAARSAWHDSTSNPAARADVALDKIITDLAATAGADRVGASASGGLSAGSAQDQLVELDTGKAGLALANIFTLIQNLNLGATVGNGNNTGVPDSLEARLESTIVDTGTSNRTLLWEVTDPATSEIVRVYASNGGGGGAGPAIEVTSNAVWDGTQFDKDIATRAGLVRFAREGIQHYARVAAGPWNDTTIGWDGGRFVATYETTGGGGYEILVENGFIQFENPGTKTNLGVATAPAPDALYSINMCRAWGRFVTDVTPPSIVDGFNFNTTAYSASDVLITYHTAMSINGGVPSAVLLQASGAEVDRLETFNEGANGFTIRLFTETLDVLTSIESETVADCKFVQTNLTTSGHAIGFVVHGRQS